MLTDANTTPRTHTLYTGAAFNPRRAVCAHCGRAATWVVLGYPACRTHTPAFGCVATLLVPHYHADAGWHLPAGTDIAVALLAAAMPTG